MNTELVIAQINNFMLERVPVAKPIVVFLSGGVDSDVVARLAVAAFEASRVVGVTCLQSGQESSHVDNAKRLAATLNIEHTLLDLAEMPETLAKTLAMANLRFDDKGNAWLLTARSKCALRTAIAALYHDRGYYVFGCGNRTELRTGFFMPLGDAVCHSAPILHLYKTEVYLLAEALGVDKRVVAQPASAGFWPGQSDLEDLSYWLFHGSPIIKPVDFTSQDITEIERIKSLLTFQKLDIALQHHESGRPQIEAAAASGIGLDIIERIYRLSDVASKIKLYPVCNSLL